MRIIHCSGKYVIMTTFYHVAYKTPTEFKMVKKYENIEFLKVHQTFLLPYVEE